MSLSLCSSSSANTGELACDKARGVLKKIFIDNGKVAASGYADEATLFASLVTKSKLSKSDSQKLFVINEAQDVADASDANKEGTLGLGFKAVLIEGKPAYKVKIFAGADLLKRLRVWNNQIVRVREYDANSTIWGTKSGTDSIGFQAKLFFTGNKIATGQNVEEGIVEFTVSILSTSEYFDNPFWASLAVFNVEDIKALIDVPLSFVSNSSNVHKIAMKIPGSNMISPYSIGSESGTAIAALATDFSAKSGAGSSPATSLAITSIAYDSVLDALTLTYDNTAYGTATGNLKLIPPTPGQLDTGDVTNVELLSTLYAKP